MNRANNYRNEIKILFDEWESAHRSGGMEHASDGFIRDSVVCPEKWFDQEVRPLFLLKEEYNSEADRGENWNLWDLLRGKRGQVKMSTWRKVAQWTRGLLGTTQNQVPPFSNKPEMNQLGNEYLEQIAVVNLKKSGGTRKSSWVDLSRYVDQDRDRLFREISTIDPSVIICGSTFGFLETILGENNNILGEKGRFAEGDKKRFFVMTLSNGNKVIVLEYWHPSWFGHPEEEFYDMRMSGYQRALKASYPMSSK